MEEPGRVDVVIVSGGMGEVPIQLLNTLLVQFDNPTVDVHKRTLVRSIEEVEEDLLRLETGSGVGLVVHALVDPMLRHALIQRCEAHGIDHIDTFGPLLAKLSINLRQRPHSHPGRYRELHRDYYQRVEAIEFAIDHDDSQDTESVLEADIVFVGVSRTGKTPLSVYLAMQGYKVANVSFVPGIALPAELSQVDPKRVVGLVIEPTELIAHRRRRGAELGIGTGTDYTTGRGISQEVEDLKLELRRRRWAAINTSRKPLESIALEVVNLITKRLGQHAKRKR